jgi:hypothetical protein
MKQFKWLAIVAAVAVTVAVFAALFPSATVRYRLTLEAEVEGKPTNGSSVVEVAYRANPRILGASAQFVTEVRGEAVVLDLGQRGTLFALLKEGEDSRSNPDNIVLRAFNFPGGALPRPVEKGIGDVRKLSGKVQLPLKSLPLLVRFRDINDPMTIEKVDPLDLEKSFGPEAKLTRATLEIVPAGIPPLSWIGITGEPLTDSLEKKLAWLNALRSGGYVKFASGGPMGPILYGGDFKTGRYP